MRYLRAIRAASITACKSSHRACSAAITGSGASPWRPKTACSRSRLLGLGRAGRSTGPPRWMSMTSSGSSRETARPMVSVFRSSPGPLVVVTPSEPAVRRSQCRAHACDLVFGLEGPHTEVLVLGELVQHVRGRGDRVAAEEHGQLGEVARGHYAPGQGGVARDVGVGARRQMSGLDLVGRLEHLGRLAEVPPGLERQGVGLPHHLVGEALCDPVAASSPAAGCTSSSPGRARRSSWNVQRPWPWCRSA